MLSDITLGQFYPGKSLLHRMDPRMKLLLVVAVIVFIFVASTFTTLGLIVLLVLTAVLLSGVPFGQYAKSLRAILFVVLFTSILNLFYGSGEALVQWGMMRITMDGIRRAIFVAVRIGTLIVCSAVLTFTTSPTQLTDALERLLTPLRKLRVPVHEIAMMMTISLRFVPTLLEETDKIMSAQKARGADLESGGAIQRVKAMVPVLIPLIVSAFRRAMDLAMAMECRCYGISARTTKMRQLHIGTLDIMSALLVIVVAALVIVGNMLLPGWM